MKKFLSVLLILIATCLTLTGCTTSVKNDAQPNETEETEVTDETLEVPKPVDTDNYVYNENVLIDDFKISNKLVVPTIKDLEPGVILLKEENGAYTEAVKLVEKREDGWTYVYPKLNEIFKDYKIEMGTKIDYSNAIVYEQELIDETLEVAETEETVDIADCFSEDYYVKGTMVIPGSHTLEAEFTFKDGEFYDEFHGDSYVRFVRETEDSIVLYVNFGQIEAEEATFDRTTLPSLSNTDVETKHWGPGVYSVGHDEIYLEFIKK